MTSQPEPTLSQPGLSLLTSVWLWWYCVPLRPLHQSKACALWLVVFTCAPFLTQDYSLPESAYSGNIKPSPVFSSGTAQSFHGTAEVFVDDVEAQLLLLPTLTPQGLYLRAHLQFRASVLGSTRGQ